MTIFNDFSAPKKFLSDIRNSLVPFHEVSFLDVSEPGKAFSGLRRNGRLTFREITIFNDVSAPEKISSRKTKLPGSRSRSDHFWKFRCLGKRILPSGETTGLPLTKDHFNDVSAKKFLPKYEMDGIPLAK